MPPSSLRTQGAVRRGVEPGHRADVTATGFSNRSAVAYGMPLKIAMSTGVGTVIAHGLREAADAPNGVVATGAVIASP